MLRHHAHMIIEHEALVVQHDLGILPAEKPCPLRLSIGEIGQIVDQRGDQHKEHNTEQAVAQEGGKQAVFFSSFSALLFFCIFLLFRSSKTAL